MNNMLGRYLFIVAAIYLCGCAALAVGGAAGTAVAVGTDSRGANVVVDDQTLEHSVNDVLDAQVPGGSFTVASFNQHVLLAGQVPNAEDKYKAELAVTNTSGVKSVWNYLTISNTETVSDIARDAYLTSAAKSRLIAQKGVNANNVKVVTCGAVVYLLGYQAGDPVQVKGAADGIKNISGVTKVVNLIQK